MELFSEIYSRYYRLVIALLRRPAQDRRAVERFVAEHGFGESTLHLLPKLLYRDGWRLLEQAPDGTYTSRLKHLPRRPMSLLEKAWLKAVLPDERSGLFLDPNQRQALLDVLGDVEPLYPADAIREYDRYLDGDPFCDRAYIQRFRLILQALRQRTLLRIAYTNRTGRVLRDQYAPLKLEYSQKDDKLRLYAARVKAGKVVGFYTLNLARMADVHAMDAAAPEVDLDQFFTRCRREQPIVFEVASERNALERVMIEFSAYEKRSVFDPDTGRATCELYCAYADETEVLIRLLGFGPLVRVLGPQGFVEQVKERVYRQAELFSHSNVEASL